VLFRSNASVGSLGPFTRNANAAGEYHGEGYFMYGITNNVSCTVNGVQSNTISPWRNW
jgi:hypothetical protein